jgi:hypothetical protein
LVSRRSSDEDSTICDFLNKFMKGNLLGPDIEARQIQTTQKPLFDPTAITPEQYKLNHNYFTLQELLQQPNYSLTQQLNLLYFGAVQNGVKHGLGVLVTPHSLYEGEFSLDRKMGKGYAVLPNGSQYHGDFANDRPHGRGLLTHGEEYYMGDFQNGAMEGEGLWRNAQG